MSLLLESHVPAVRPDGTPFDHRVLSTQTRAGAIIVPFVTHRGMVYVGVVEQYRPPVGKGTVEVPRGGTADLSEAEARRELFEETGQDPVGMRQLGVIHPDTGLMSTNVGVWIAPIEPIVDEHGTWTRQNEGHIDDGDGTVFRWVGYGELLGMVSRGEITCGMTLAALALFQTTNIPRMAA